MAEGRYKKGFIVPTLRGAANWLKPVLPMGWLEFACPTFKESAVATEAYVLFWFVLELAIGAALLSLYNYVDYVVAVGWVIYLLVTLRVPEIVVRATDVKLKNVISPVRTLILAAINYVELMVCFGLVYALNYRNLVDQSHSVPAPLWFQHPSSAEPITAFYFSVITQLTIGFGDVYATGWLRIIVVVQGLIGALFVIVVLGRAISASPTQ
jgi:Ion channel